MARGNPARYNERKVAMHELSIALNLLEAATEVAARQGSGRVVAIHLHVGPLAGVVPEALVSAFQVARTGSPLEAAELVITEIPVVAYCPACAAERAVVSVQQLCCAVCGTPTPQIVHGRELDIVALEIEP